MPTVNANPMVVGQITDDPRWNERNGWQPGIGEPSFFSLPTAPPASTLGNNGDFAFILGGGAGTALYQKRAGAWAEITTTLGASTFAGHILSTGTAPGAAAGANAGGSPPAPVVTTGATDSRGNITFGTGTTPAAGAMVVVTFAANYTTAGPPSVVLIAANAATVSTAAIGPLGAILSGSSGAWTGFTIQCATAPAASQANTTYSVNYEVIG